MAYNDKMMCWLLLCRAPAYVLIRTEWKQLCCCLLLAVLSCSQCFCLVDVTVFALISLKLLVNCQILHLLCK